MIIYIVSSVGYEHKELFRAFTNQSEAEFFTKEMTEKVLKIKDELWKKRKEYNIWSDGDYKEYTAFEQQKREELGDDNADMLFTNKYIVEEVELID